MRAASIIINLHLTVSSSFDRAGVNRPHSRRQSVGHFQQIIQILAGSPRRRLCARFKISCRIKAASGIHAPCRLITTSGAGQLVRSGNSRPPTVHGRRPAPGGARTSYFMTTSSAQTWFWVDKPIAGQVCAPRPTARRFPIQGSYPLQAQAVPGPRVLHSAAHSE
jgi:hypothetical protein